MNSQQRRKERRRWPIVVLDQQLGEQTYSSWGRCFEWLNTNVKVEHYKTGTGYVAFRRSEDASAFVLACGNMGKRK